MRRSDPGAWSCHHAVMVSTRRSDWCVRRMVSLSLIGKIRFRVSGKRESLVPIGQALLALKRGDHTLVRQPDDPKFSAPRNEQGLADATTGSLINDARA